jgi:hypothetical protein
MKINTLNQLFKEVYCEPTGLDSNKPLSWFMDYINSSVYENKLMDTYEVTYEKYGWAHSSDNWCWGPPYTDIVSDDKLKELQNDSTYRIIKLTHLRNEWYNALVAKITPEGQRVEAKSYTYTPGKNEEIIKPKSPGLLINVT